MTDLATADLLTSAGAVHDGVVDLRRAIHREPELGMGNPRTRDRILAALDGLGLDIRTGPDEASWIIADLPAGDGPTVLLRADTDALPMTEETDEPFRSVEPGRAHACGHDAHVAMLVGAARVLADRRDELAGTVRFVFQPGEEGPGGARVLVAEGACDGVEAAYALHITPNIPAGMIATRPGPFMAAADEIDATIRGQGGHASTPHLCVDPITVAAEIVTAWQTMITRVVNAHDPAVLTIARIEAGTTTNVIPETARLGGTIRTFSEHTRAIVHEAVLRVADHIAQAHRCTAEVDIELGYPVTVNHPDAAAFAAATATEVLGAGRYVEMPFPVMGAEDFSYYLHEVPGAMAFLGVCPDDVDNAFAAPPCHSNKMRLHEPAMANGVAYLAGLALKALGR